MPPVDARRPFDRLFVVVMVTLAAQAEVWGLAFIAVLSSSHPEDAANLTPLLVVATCAAVAAVLAAVGVAASAQRRAVLAVLVVAIVATGARLAVLGLSEHLPRYFRPELDAGVLLVLLGALAGFLPHRARQGDAPADVPPRRITNPVATAAVVTSALGPLSAWVGFIALVQIRRRGDRGRTSAVVGIVVGLLWLVVGGAYVTLLTAHWGW